MSRDLPIQPNLEHLRKQAKAQLNEMRRRNPAAQLSDAQLAVARSYGFANWPSLRAHVEELTGGRVAAAVALAGRWTPNLSKSTLNPASPFVAATIELECAEERLVVRHLVADASGRVERGVHALDPDGQAHDQGNGYTLTACWRGARKLEFVARKDGHIVGQGSYEASGDGRTLIISGEGQTIVCDRAPTREAGDQRNE